MSLSVGIVGLPNVGKSTLFNALANMQAESANFPFCTIEPNVGIVPVWDKRLHALAALYPGSKVIPTTLEFVDIAGLVKGAASGEGLGNQFLGHIRAVDAVLHVVRCFDDDDVVHVHGHLDPIADVEIIMAELALKDLESVAQKRLSSQKALKQATGALLLQLQQQEAALQQLEALLQQGKPARQLANDPSCGAVIRDLGLLTGKPMLLVANVAEADLVDPSHCPHFIKLQHYAQAQGLQLLPLCSRVEAEIAELAESDRAAYLAEMGLSLSGLQRVSQAAYQLLTLITFFTAGPKEVRAWTVREHTRAPQAAGVIHSDFERGFIRAEVMRCQDLLQYQSETAVRAQGLLRLEGKEYVVVDGDVMHFRFHV